MRHGTRQLLVSARHGAGHRHLTWSYAAAWPDFTPPLTPDGKPLDMTGITWRWYPGDETQTADPFIAARMGVAGTPAYLGTAYVVFEELALSTYGNRLPQLSFEVFRPLADPDTAEG